ncbi:hypothetical protein BGZ47_007102 [Haplosporangium gracile]|nr:hypothetical protein BGZ47_007102 [Haplosporangium gracile]
MSLDTIKEGPFRYCFHITGLELEDGTGDIVPEYLTNIVNNVSEICFQYKYITIDSITAILLHQHTLKTVKHSSLRQDQGFDKDEVIPVNEPSSVSGYTLQLITRHCSLLEESNINGYEMNMDIVKPSEWTCKDLKTLCVTIKHLDTKEKILKTIALWRAGCRRHWQEKVGLLMIVKVQDETDQSIGARVARHLIKFDKLSRVWLGYQTWISI